MKFAARIDAWAICLIAMGSLVAIGVGIFCISIAGGELVGVAGGVVMVLVGVAMSSFLMRGGYEITSSHVVLLWGPLRFRLIRIEKIVEAAPVNSTSATLHVASSSHAIRITGSRKSGGSLPPTVSISPRDRTGFLQALADASPDLQLSDDGSVRLRSEAPE